MGERRIRRLEELWCKMVTSAYQLEYWRDGKWYVGRRLGAPGLFSQGATFEELEENIRDADRMMTVDDDPSQR